MKFTAPRDEKPDEPTFDDFEQLSEIDTAQQQTAAFHVTFAKKVAYHTSEQANGKFTPEISSLRALMEKQFQAIKWIIPDILPEGCFLFAGKPKIGKSWFMLALALAVASGGTVLGSKRVPQGDVLYLALEDIERALQERVRKLLPSGAEIPSRFEYALRWSKMDVAALEWLETWIKAHPQARLIVVDTWAKVRPDSKKKNAYDDDYAAIAPLKDLAAKYGICILITIHLRKQGASDTIDEVNATTGLNGCVDGTLILRRGRIESEGTLFGTGREIQEFELALAFTDCQWRLIGEAAIVRLSNERKAILDAVGKGNTTIRDIADTVGRKADAALRVLLSKMVQSDELRSVGYGLYALPLREVA